MDTRIDRAAAIIVVAALCGAAISVYLTVAHYAGAPLACLQQGPIDCGAVTTSSYSMVGDSDVPVSALGIAWFLVNGLLGILAIRRTAMTGVRVLELIWTIAGLGVVLYLVRAEIAVIGRICEWCTAVHILVVVSFLAALRRVQVGA